jgi:acyl-coenzyme A thioesterase PaaI-like protein
LENALAMADTPAFQDLYPDRWSHCYGCGRLNEHGLHVRSFWEGDQTVARVVPRPEHTSLPGYAYGGLIASAIDCHSTGSAAAAAHRAAGGALEAGALPRFVTARLEVDFLAPAPVDAPLELRSTIEEVRERKVTVSTELTAAGKLCARGRAVLVRVPDSWLPG